MKKHHIRLNENEFLVVMKAATSATLSPEDHDALKAAAWSIYKRNNPAAADKLERENEQKLEKQRQAELIAAMEAGCAPSEESKQLYRNLVATLGENATWEDLARYGLEMIERSERDPKN